MATSTPRNLLMLLALLALAHGSWQAARAQETEVEAPNGDGLSPETKLNMQMISRFLCRRALSGGIMRPKGVSIGLDLALVRFPSLVNSQQVAQVQSQFLAIPMPLLVTDIATDEAQTSLGGIYLTNSPLPDSKITYFSARLGFDRFLSRKSNVIYGASFTHTTFRADRTVSLAIGEDQQAFGIQGNNGEIRLAYQTGVGGTAGDPMRRGPFMVFHATTGFSRIASSFVGEIVDSGYSFAGNSQYVGLGGSACAANRAGCVTLELQYDSTLGLLPAFVASARM